MSYTTEGGPAFPLQPASMPEMHYLGMSLRDWFAGQALANVYASHDCKPGIVAEWAYEVADAMLAQRNENKELKGDKK